VEGLSASSAYSYQLVAYRGTLNDGAVFGGLSNAVDDTTAAAPSTTSTDTTTAKPGAVGDLSVASTTDSSATVAFTEVGDGTGSPAYYEIRYAPTPIGYGWGSATIVTSGDCPSGFRGSGIGTHRTCTVPGLSPSTSYDLQVVAWRNDSAGRVYGALSNVATGSTSAASDTTSSTSSGSSSSHEPAGYGVIAHETFDATLLSGPPGTCSLLGILAGCWFEYDPSGNLGVASVADASGTSTEAMQVTFPTGLAPGYSPGLFQGWATGSETNSTQYRAVYESGWVRVPTPDFEMQAVGVKFLGFLGVAQAGQGHVPNQVYFVAFNPSGTTSLQQAVPLSVAQQGNQSRRMDENVATGPVFTFGPWHHYEYVVTLNDVGQANGTLKVWWDGQLIMDYSDVVWRDAANPSGFYGRRWDPVWGGRGGGNRTRDDYLQIDDVYISGETMP